MLLVSACLTGVNCRFDGAHKRDQRICDLVARGQALPVCPEQLGGLSTPRPPSEIVRPDESSTVSAGWQVLAGQAVVKNDRNEDVSANFVAGAEQTLLLARLVHAREAILKDGSPSCGSTTVYDGSFSGNRIGGEGVTTALLRRAGIQVRNERKFDV